MTENKTVRMAELDREKKLNYLRKKVDPVLVPVFDALLETQPDDVPKFIRSELSTPGKNTNKLVDVAILRKALGKVIVPENFSAGSPLDVCDQLELPVCIAARPRSAVGQFLRVIMVNDVYKLEHYPRLATAISLSKAFAKPLGCDAISTLNGDFLSPCVLTSLDGGVGMTEALDAVGFDYVCLGNHELDIGFGALKARLESLKHCKCINTNVDNPELSALPRYQEVQVGGRTVLLAGLLTEDKSIYAPTKMPDARPITDAGIALWEERKAARGGQPYDCFLPMTHQLTPLDKKTAEAWSKHSDLKSRTPVLLAGHDHEVFIDAAGSSLVVKVGMDAENIGVVDIWWDSNSVLHSSVNLVPACEFPEDGTCAALRAKSDNFVAAMMEAPLAILPTPMSSKKVRFEASDMATFLLSLLKKGLKDQAVELVLLQGGAVRAGADYEAGPFTMGNLFKELAFDCHQAIIDVPGGIIADSIKNTRLLPKPAPNFLHTDSDAIVTSDHVLTHVNGEALDPVRKYKVSIYQLLLSGLNVIEPLMTYVTQVIGTENVPDEEACMPAKEIILQTCMRDAWENLINKVKKPGGTPRRRISVIDSLPKISRKVQTIFDRFDENGDGLIDEAEVRAVFAHGSDSDAVSASLITQMMKFLDRNNDGYVDINEFAALIPE